MTVITLRLKLQHESSQASKSLRIQIDHLLDNLLLYNYHSQLARSFFCPFFKHSREPAAAAWDCMLKASFLLRFSSWCSDENPILLFVEIWTDFVMSIWNWDTLYLFFRYSLYDHFIRCWAMLHTSGLVTVKKQFQKIDFSILFFITKLRAKRAT